MRRYRRSPYLVSYWRGGRFVVENYATGRRVTAAPLALELVNVCGGWRTLDEIAARFPRDAAPEIRRLTTALADASLLEASSSGASEPALDGWSPWHPWAGFFHFGTRNLQYRTGGASASDRALRRKARIEPPPPPTKSYRRRGSLALPPPAPLDPPLARALAERRTWRRFGRQPIALRDLSTMLWHTWGVQIWVNVPGQGRIALKTSPSGGATHPGEVYVAAFRVDGLMPGLYHYDAAKHRLCQVGDGAPLRVARYLPHQPWYRSASALFLMTAVVARETWKYETARAYRAILIDAGHLCQTFCLVATSLRLAPFCSMALADSNVEADLGLDGVSEIAVYAAGVGTRPSRGASS